MKNSGTGRRRRHLFKGTFARFRGSRGLLVMAVFVGEKPSKSTDLQETNFPRSLTNEARNESFLVTGTVSMRFSPLRMGYTQKLP